MLQADRNSVPELTPKVQLAIANYNDGYHPPNGCLSEVYSDAGAVSAWIDPKHCLGCRHMRKVHGLIYCATHSGV